MTQVSTGESEVVAKKPEATNEHEKPREKKERIRAPTKVVVRRLPPTLTKDAFINQISPLPEHDYLYFVRPDKSLGPFAFSRAYINFIKQEDIFTFKEQFDNYTFMDKKGNEYPAVVEFAPFQRLPKKRMGRKKDPKMGTLENDPAYITFLEAREAKLAESGSAQHCPLEYFPPPEKKKITTTPLLDFLRQRRAERQRLRDERREERRRKEQERKRLKDVDRERRRGSGKPESSSSRESASDSVLKVLRNPEHEKEAKDDSNRGSGSKENKDKTPQSLTKKREDERQRNNRDKERERKDRQIQETRQRDTKVTGSVKSYRDDRQKQMEIRAQRKLPEDQRRKTSFERSQGHTKTTEIRQSQESEKGQNNSKTSDTRQSHEFDRSSSKSSESRHSQEFERNQGSTKSTDSRKEYERHTHSNRDTDHKKHYQSNNELRKAPSERFQSHTKDNEKQNKESEHRKSYRDSEPKRGYNKDIDQKRNTYNAKSPRSYNEGDKKISSEHRIHYKEDQKQSKDSQDESLKSEKLDDTKKWEQMGAKPKKKISLDMSNKSELKGDKIGDHAVKSEKSLNKLDRRDSSESLNKKCDSDSNVEDEDFESAEKESRSVSEILSKRRNSLDSNEQSFIFQSTNENCNEDVTVSSEIEKQDSDDKPKAEVNYLDKDNFKPFTDYRYGIKPSKRRGSLDSGDHDSDVQGSKGMSRSATGSDWSMDSKLKRNHSLDLDGHCWEVDSQGDSSAKNSDKSFGDLQKIEDKDDKDRNSDVSGNSLDGDNKKDPRLERRIRNKDRPTMEIYRPGMGRFSLQRKEREKGAGPGTAGSSMEQESPSSSPSPTPTNTNRISTSTKTSKTGTELRSMTFKRSVSREK